MQERPSLLMRTEKAPVHVQRLAKVISVLKYTLQWRQPMAAHAHLNDH